MAKTRRNKSKQRKTRRNRKQKGSGRIFVTNPRISSIPSQLIDFNEKTTPRNILKQYINQTNLSQKPDFQFYKYEPNPPFIFTQESEPSRFLNAWNTPWKTNKGKLLQDKNTIEIRFNEKLSEIIKQRRLETIQITFSLIKRILSLSKFKNGTKIIIQNYAVTDAIPKNVNQQFKFHMPPFSPILHLDFDYFKSESAGSDFYKYLNFQETYSDIIVEFLRKKFNLSDQGIRNICRFYIKRAGTPLVINPNPASGPTDEEKTNYLNEVYKQAEKTDDTDLQQDLMNKTEEEKREIIINYLKEKELLMCIIRHDTMVDSNKENPLSLDKYLEDKPQFKYYIWSE